MTGVVIAVLVVAALAAIATTDDRERLERLLHRGAVSRREAMRQHPSNRGRAIVKDPLPPGVGTFDTSSLFDVPEIQSASIVPLVCPVCDATFGHGYLNEHDNRLFGWIEKRHHDCTKAGAA